MSKVNPLVGLIGNYGDSDDESDDGGHVTGHIVTPEVPGTESRPLGPAPAPYPGYNNYTNVAAIATPNSAAVHPAPIPHCPWSACYDETSGFTYYWNQQTNAVTWEAPPEYLLALKLAQQQLHQSGSAEVSAEEWQLYQQALAEKQNVQNNKVVAKSATVSKPVKKTDKNHIVHKEKSKSNTKKRPYSDDEDEKIELITSYHNSDSESNDESETPKKVVAAAAAAPPLPKSQPKPIIPHKKPKVKSVEYGPALPPTQPTYTVPIGPELPPGVLNNGDKTPENKGENSVKEDKKSGDEDSQDESALFQKLKNKAKLLEKLGGELPKDLQKMIEEDNFSNSSTPKKEEINAHATNIDDLLEEIEKKELPKVAKAKKLDVVDEKSNDAGSNKNSPKHENSPSVTPLFPSFKNIKENSPTPTSLVSQDTSNSTTTENDDKKSEASEKKGANLYLMGPEERIENANKKKLRICNSVLPAKKGEEVAYTTKYSEFIEGFSGERTGLGFSKEEDESESPKNTISYGNGLMFTKGETLNEDKKDEDLDDLTDLLEAKLKYLNQLQPCVLTPVQEMLIQMQTLVSAFRAGALSSSYWSRWAATAARSLSAHEAGAAPPGWRATFLRSEGRYCYRREADGLVQWEYPAVLHTDMDISNTPPHTGGDAKDEVVPECIIGPPPPPTAEYPSPARTPPPPAWPDPPPPGCLDLPPLPHTEQKQQIGDELASFYSDIAELEKQQPSTASNSPEPVEVKEKHRDKDKDKDVKTKKKSKVKISSSMGLKHKSVSNLVAKWQQVAEEIHSD